MERVKAPNGKWSLFCPHACPGLSDVVGQEFVDLYTRYEDAGKALKTVSARDLWFKILDAQMETGTPYLLYKDAANKKSNQQNLGTIKSSNLCVVYETQILTDKGHLCIGELEGQQVNVWNGHEFSLVTVKKTGTDQPIMKVTCGVNGDKQNVKSLECTPQHKFYITVEEDVLGEFNHWQRVTYVKKIDAKDLKLGMRLIGCGMPSNNGSFTEGCHSFTEGSYDFTEGCYDFTEGCRSYDFMSVVALEDYGKSADTFCFTEPKRHMGVFNGILTGQCTEIIEYSNENETAVCNLASIALPAFVNTETKTFNYDNLHEITQVVTYNLNRVIDINFYPTEKTKLSNLRHRPIGIGVQGLADVYMMMDIAFHSEEAKEVNKLIFETIYHAALTKSNELAVERKQKYSQLTNLLKMNMLIGKELFLPENVVGAYSSFAGSPASKGILQFDMWGVTPSDRYDWAQLKQSIVENGLRNSLLVAPMPTASTSQILGYNECFEPFTSNIYTRRTLAGEFVIINKYLMRDLMELGLWNEQIKNNIILNKGSVQQLTMLPEHLRNKYKIVWEIPMKHIIDMSADRGAYICQSQSLNLWMEDPIYNKLTSMHFYAWEKGLKTGIYYLRRKAKHNAQQFTIEPESNNTENSETICEMCSA
jgi:ribonucleotide reductase alpha subunit